MVLRLFTRFSSMRVFLAPIKLAVSLASQLDLLSRTILKPFGLEPKISQRDQRIQEQIKLKKPNDFSFLLNSLSMLLELSLALVFDKFCEFSVLPFARLTNDLICKLNESDFSSSLLAFLWLILDISQTSLIANERRKQA